MLLPHRGRRRQGCTRRRLPLCKHYRDGARRRGAGRLAVGVVCPSIRPVIVMPVGEKCCSVTGEKGAENSRPADICDSALPLGAPWGGADAEKPLEENEAVIRSCPTGMNAASVTGAVILTLLSCIQLQISNQSLWHSSWMVSVLYVAVIPVTSSFTQPTCDSGRH